MRLFQKEALSLRLRNVICEAEKRFRRLLLSRKSEKINMTVSGRAHSGFDPDLALQ
jgi:hypothetical protein